jgi:SpoVK/Ycf46/Vps4 family AAA+-type ATPase
MSETLAGKVKFILDRYPEAVKWFSEALTGTIATAPAWFKAWLKVNSIVDSHGKVKKEAKEIIESIITRKLVTENSIWKKVKPTLEWFDDIVGYEDVKQQLIEALESPHPIHVLFIGPPASAKTLFLEALSNMYGVPIIVASKGSMTGEGLRDFIVRNTPELLLIDEIDKVKSRKDLSVLLFWMENQRLPITMVTRWGETEVTCPTKCVVVSACNNPANLPQELLSRFDLKYTFKRYTAEEAKKICIHIVTKRFGLAQDVAEAIATAVIDELGMLDVRQCRGIAKFMPKTVDDVKRIVSVLKKYKG